MGNHPPLRDPLEEHGYAVVEGALLMCPLLLHASSPCQRPVHRRVLHIEYCARSLPDGLAWREENQ